MEHLHWQRHPSVSERIAPLLCSQACYCALRAPSQTAHIPSSYSLRLEDPLPDLPRDPVAISVQDASSERTPRVHRATAEAKPGTHYYVLCIMQCNAMAGRIVTGKDGKYFCTDCTTVNRNCAHYTHVDLYDFVLVLSKRKPKLFVLTDQNTIHSFP